MTNAHDGNANWLADFFFAPIQAERERREEDPGLPAYPWDVHGKPSLFEGHDYPLSYVAAARTKRYPVLINLDELRRSVHLALAGTPDTRTPQQKSRDAWAAYQAAKEKYERRDSRSDRGAGAPEARQAPSDAQDRPANGQEPQASGPPEGAPPAP
jgi:hypothetical protein